MALLRSTFPLFALPLLLLTSTAIFAPACGSSVVGTGGGATGGADGTGGAVSCPTEQPQGGTACSIPIGECHYPVECCSDTIVTCSGGVWQVEFGACIGEAVPDPCPSTAPATGTACTPGCLVQQCAYGDCGDGTTAIFAFCDGAVWQVSYVCPQDAGAGGIPLGGKCGQSAGGGACESGLACCYPCGIPGCDFTCQTPCNAGDPGCAGGCPQVP